MNCFENLALITVSANSKFSNMVPNSKNENYPDIIEQSPKLVLMRKMIADAGRAWDESLAEQHGNEMKKILKGEIERFKM